jgi:protein AFG1
MAKFDFEDLCGQPLSAADYIEITNKFSTIFVLNIPKMGLNQKDLARRFITFIDGESVLVVIMLFLADHNKPAACYEGKVP